MSDAVTLIALLLGAAGIWHWSVLGRERVLVISTELCRDLGLQRLDDSVALRGMRLRWVDGPAIERRYEFEFSTDGADRRRGEITLRGLALIWARLAHPNGAIFIDPSSGAIR